MKTVFPLVDFSHALMFGIRKLVNAEKQEIHFKEKLVRAIEDLLCVCAFASIPPQIRELMLPNVRSDKKVCADENLTAAFRKQLKRFQIECLIWLRSVLPTFLKLTKEEYMKSYYHLLFLDSPDSYSSKDSWPSESEKRDQFESGARFVMLLRFKVVNYLWEETYLVALPPPPADSSTTLECGAKTDLYLKIIADFGVSEEILKDILSTPLKGDISLSSMVVIEITEQLVRRILCCSIDNSIVLNDCSLVDLLFDLCLYRPPENIALPTRYKPVPMAITTPYWKAWLILTLMACHNPRVFGNIMWTHYPTGRVRKKNHLEKQSLYTKALPDISIPDHVETRKTSDSSKKAHFSSLYPGSKFLSDGPRFTAVGKALDIPNDDRVNLMFDDGNAVADTWLSFTKTSLGGYPRKPPPLIIEQLKLCSQQMNLRLRLCSSRNPDFLLAIINRQGASQTVPWLSAIIEQNEGSVALFPVECLCEFLFNQIDVHRQNIQRCAYFTCIPSEEQQTSGFKRIQNLASKLRLIVIGEQADTSESAKVLLYFLNRLHSAASSDRAAVIEALSMIVSLSHSPTENEATSPFVNSSLLARYGWLLRDLPRLPSFHKISKATTEALLQCFLVETDISLLHAYFNFISLIMHKKEQDLESFCLVFAKLICDRQHIFSALVPVFQTDWQLFPVEERTLSILLEVFSRYLKQTFQTRTDHFTWSASQDKFLVQWGENMCATLDAQAVTAMLMLLTPTPPRDREYYDQLLDSWFTGTPKPTVYLLDTTEEAELITDQLSVFMLRSCNEDLVKCGT
ncbi:unnamed protein product [Soboliphyme baturini]|uniref:Sorting nexin-14 n=1 Tax=Soboliphyme baturini TaxID=241478 RepID=A0A183IRX9_9BILA|nr:unnamed protein product [Soboliphyme baturini]